MKNSRFFAEARPPPISQTVGPIGFLDCHLTLVVGSPSYGSVAVGGETLALARRALLVLIAAALAFAPVGASAAAGKALIAHVTMADPEPGHHNHAAHDDQGMMHAEAAHGSGSSPPCKHDSGTCSCSDKATCAQTCLAKCFGQMAILVDIQAARHALASYFADRPADPPPDWSATPQPPPPRS